MSNTTTHPKPVRLTFRDGEVMVTAKDQDIFFISAEKATEACRNVTRQEERVSSFTDGFIIPLATWCKEHAQAISACYVVPPESAVLPVYVVGAGEQYDFELAEQLVALAYVFEKNWSVHLSQIPKCDNEELAGYFSLDRALQVYGG